MPAAPEFFDGEGEIRAPEVGHQVDAEQLCAANGNIGVPREVTIDFHGKHDSDDDKDQSDIGGGIVVYFVDDAGEDIGNHQLLEITPYHQLQTVSHIVISKRAFLLILWQQAVGSADRSGQKLREEGDEERIIAEMPLRRDFADLHRLTDSAGR